jgi:hypothetical protein
VVIYDDMKIGSTQGGLDAEKELEIYKCEVENI